MISRTLQHRPSTPLPLPSVQPQPSCTESPTTSPDSSFPPDLQNYTPPLHSPSIVHTTVPPFLDLEPSPATPARSSKRCGKQSQSSPCPTLPCPLTHTQRGRCARRSQGGRNDVMTVLLVCIQPNSSLPIHRTSASPQCHTRPTVAAALPPLSHDSCRSLPPSVAHPHAITGALCHFASRLSTKTHIVALPSMAAAFVPPQPSLCLGLSG